MRSPKRRILYSEDDPDSRELIKFVFTRGGYEVVCAESGPQALHLAKGASDKLERLLFEKTAS
jgi:CheY-like chemotaxis protein